MLEVEARLRDIEDQGLRRDLVPPLGYDFSSNDYLGLSQNPILRQALIEALQQGLSLGSTSSRLVRGHSEVFEKAESELARFLGRPASLIFNSGYAANMGLITALGQGGVVFSDELNHASIIDGVRLSRAQCQIYRHNDLNYLEDLLNRCENKHRLIVTESLFSMDGDFAPIENLIELSQRHQAFLIVDEAHATGVWGEQGRGLLYRNKDLPDEVISVHTCGKALGSFGAFVGLSDGLKKYLVNQCRHLIYTTALPPLMVLQIQKAMELVIEKEESRRQLQKLAQTFRTNLEAMGSIGFSQSQIIPFMVEGNLSVTQFSQHLISHGFDVRAIRYPTVKKGQERLRLCVHAFNQFNEMQNLVELMALYTKRIR